MSRFQPVACALFVLVLLSFAAKSSAIPTNPAPATFQEMSSSQGVNLATGDFDTAVPLFTVPGRGGLDYPVTLNYHAGIQVQQAATPVGLGWSIESGSISRSVAGIPDDYASATTMHKIYQFPCDTGTWFDRLIASIKKSDAYRAGMAMFESAWQEIKSGNYNFDIKIVSMPDVSILQSSRTDCDSVVTDDVVDGVQASEFGAGYLGHANGQGPAYGDYAAADFFSVNGQGMSGSLNLQSGLNTAFFSSTKGIVNLNSIHSPYDAVTVSFSRSSLDGSITDFTITDLDGKKYFYADTVSVVPNGQGDGFQYASHTLSRQNVGDSTHNFMEAWLKRKYAVQWLLTAIYSPDYADANNDGVPNDGDSGSWIKFVYTRGTAAHVKTPFDGSWDSSGDGWSFKGDEYIEQVYLSSIETPTSKALFSYDTARTDGFDSDHANQASRLSQATLYSKSGDGAVTLVKGVQLTHSNNLALNAPGANPGTGRLELDSVKEYGSSWNLLQTTSFQYANGYQAGLGDNPNYDKAKIDRWGYYCQSCTADQDNPFGGSGIKPMAWSLTKITWPTGGSTQISYDADRYVYVNNYYNSKARGDEGRDDTKYGGGVRINQIRNCDGLGQCSRTNYYYNANGFKKTESDGYDLPTGGESSGVASAEPISKYPMVSGEMSRTLFPGSRFVHPGVYYSKVTVVPQVADDGSAPFGYTIHDFTTTMDYPNDGPYYVTAMKYCGEDSIDIPNPAGSPAIYKGPPNADVSALLNGVGQRYHLCRTDSNGLCQIDWEDGNGNPMAPNVFSVRADSGNCQEQDRTVRVVLDYGMSSCLDANGDGTCDLFELSPTKRNGGSWDHSSMLGLENDSKDYDSRGNLVAAKTTDYASDIQYENNLGNGYTGLNVKMFTTRVRAQESASAAMGIETSQRYEYHPTITLPTAVHTDEGQPNEKTSTTIYKFQSDDAFVTSHRFTDVLQSNGTNGTDYNLSSRSVYDTFGGTFARVKEARQMKSQSADEIVSYIDNYDIYGNPLQERDPKGNPVLEYYGGNFACDNSAATWAHSKVTCVEDALHHQTKYSYDTQGRLQYIRDPNNAVTSFAYDEYGRLQSVTPPGFASPTTTYSYHIAGSSIGANNLNSVTVRQQVSGTTWSESRDYFDGLGRKVRSEQEDGAVDIVSETEYDELGRAVKQYLPHLSSVPKSQVGFTQTFYENSPLGRLVMTYAPGSNPQWHETGNFGQGLSQDGQVSFTVPSDGFYWTACAITGNYGPDAKAYARLVDSSINSQLTGSPVLSSCAVGYDNIPSTPTSRDFPLLVAGHTYRLEAGHEGANIAFGISVNHQQINNDFVVKAYVANPDIANTLWTYAADPQGNLARTLSDSSGQTLRTIAADGGWVSFQNDALGRVLSLTDPYGQLTSHTYDSLGRMLSTVNPDAGTITATYDDAGNALTHTRNGMTVSYGYDALNRMVHASYPDATQDIFYTFEGGASDNLVGKLHSANGPQQIVTYAYNAKQQLWWKNTFFQGSCSDGTPQNAFAAGCPDVNDDGAVNSADQAVVQPLLDAITLVHAVPYTDPLYNPYLDFNRDGQVAFAEKARFVNALGGTRYHPMAFYLGYGYDDAGHVTDVSYPVGYRWQPDYSRYTWHNSYDQLQRLTHSGSDNNANTIDYLYTPEGLLQTETFSNGVIGSYAYNAKKLLQSQQVQFGTLKYFQEAYAYDPSANLHSLSIGTDPTQNTAAIFSYDSMNRLTNVDSQNVNYRGQNVNYYGVDESFTYDNNGNRLSYNGVPYAYNGASRNQMTGNGSCGFGYDGNGSVVSMTCGGRTPTLFAYDYDGRLSKVNYPDGSCEVYRYDEAGNRVKKMVQQRVGTSTSANFYVYDGGRLMQEIDGITEARSFSC